MEQTERDERDPGPAPGEDASAEARAAVLQIAAARPALGDALVLGGASALQELLGQVLRGQVHADYLDHPPTGDTARQTCQRLVLAAAMEALPLDGAVWRAVYAPGGPGLLGVVLERLGARPALRPASDRLCVLQGRADCAVALGVAARQSERRPWAPQIWPLARAAERLGVALPAARPEDWTADDVGIVVEAALDASREAGLRALVELRGRATDVAPGQGTAADELRRDLDEVLAELARERDAAAHWRQRAVGAEEKLLTVGQAAGSEPRNAVADEARGHLVAAGQALSAWRDRASAAEAQLAGVRAALGAADDADLVAVVSSVVQRELDAEDQAARSAVIEVARDLGLQLELPGGLSPTECARALALAVATEAEREARAAGDVDHGPVTENLEASLAALGYYTPGAGAAGLAAELRRLLEAGAEPLREHLAATLAALGRTAKGRGAVALATELRELLENRRLDQIQPEGGAARSPLRVADARKFLAAALQALRGQAPGGKFDVDAALREAFESVEHLRRRVLALAGEPPSQHLHGAVATLEALVPAGALAEASAMAETGWLAPDVAAATRSLLLEAVAALNARGATVEHQGLALDALAERVLDHARLAVRRAEAEPVRRDLLPACEALDVEVDEDDALPSLASRLRGRAQVLRDRLAALRVLVGRETDPDLPERVVGDALRDLAARLGECLTELGDEDSLERCALPDVAARLLSAATDTSPALEWARRAHASLQRLDQGLADEAPTIAVARGRDRVAADEPTVAELLGDRGLLRALREYDRRGEGQDPGPAFHDVDVLLPRGWDLPRLIRDVLLPGVEEIDEQRCAGYLTRGDVSAEDVCERLVLAFEDELAHVGLAPDRLAAFDSTARRDRALALGAAVERVLE